MSDKKSPEEVQGSTTFTTGDGQVVRVQAVAPVFIQRVSAGVRARFKEAGEPIDIPEYEVKTAAGNIETWPITQELYDNGKLSNEESQQWEEHVAAMKRLVEEENTLVQRAWLLRGLVIEDPSDEWLAEQEWFGVTVPDDPRDRRLMYIEHEVLKTPEDVISAISKIARLSAAGAPPEELDAIEGAFRSALEGNLSGRFTSEPGTLADVGIPVGTASGEVLGIVPGTVAEPAVRRAPRDDGGVPDGGEDGSVGPEAEREAARGTDEGSAG